MALPDDLTDLLKQPSPCYVATLMPDGSPQLTQTWVDTDGDHILINTVEGFQKANNVKRDQRVAVTVSDPAQPFRYFGIRGRVVDTTTDGRCRAHRGAVPAVPGRPVSLVRWSRPGSPHPDHQCGQDHPAAVLSRGSVRVGDAGPMMCHVIYGIELMPARPSSVRP